MYICYNFDIVYTIDLYEYTLIKSLNIDINTHK